MSTFKSWLKFIRFPNLVIVALTQYIFRWCILEPIQNEGINLVFNNLNFSILVFTTILMTIASYVINDYYDVEIDLQNKPEKVFIGKLISKENTFRLFLALNILSLLLVTYLYITVSRLFIYVFPIFTAMIVSMWWYSYYLKKTTFWGNLFVAIFCGLVPYSIFLPEYYALPIEIKYSPPFETFEGVVYLYMIFAFVSTLYREIIKDMEDIDGDKLYGCQTIPIKYGIPFSKKFTFGIGISFFVLLIALSYFFFQKQSYL